jgi:hypothetical protein
MHIPNRAPSARPRPAGELPPARAGQPGRHERRVAMKLRLALRMAAVEDLEGQLARLCGEMMETTISTEKLYQARMLAVSLLHAKRLVALAVESAEGNRLHPYFN